MSIPEDIIRSIAKFTDNATRDVIYNTPPFDKIIDVKDVVYETDELGIKRSFYNDIVHSFLDEPAMIFPDGTKVWYNMGKIERIGDPAIITYKNNITRLEVHCKDNYIYSEQLPWVTNYVCFESNTQLPHNVNEENLFISLRSVSEDIEAFTYAEHVDISELQIFVDNFDSLKVEVPPYINIKTLYGVGTVTHRIIYISERCDTYTSYEYYIEDGDHWNLIEFRGRFIDEQQSQFLYNKVDIPRNILKIFKKEFPNLVYESNRMVINDNIVINYLYDGIYGLIDCEFLNETNRGNRLLFSADTRTIMEIYFHDTYKAGKEFNCIEYGEHLQFNTREIKKYAKMIKDMSKLVSSYTPVVMSRRRGNLYQFISPTEFPYKCYGKMLYEPYNGTPCKVGFDSSSWYIDDVLITKIE